MSPELIQGRCCKRCKVQKPGFSQKLGRKTLIFGLETRFLG